MFPIASTLSMRISVPTHYSLLSLDTHISFTTWGQRTPSTSTTPWHPFVGDAQNSLMGINTQSSTKVQLSKLSLLERIKMSIWHSTRMKIEGHYWHDLNLKGWIDTWPIWVCGYCKVFKFCFKLCSGFSTKPVKCSITFLTQDMLILYYFHL
jgi:hypothetical protein